MLAVLTFAGACGSDPRTVTDEVKEVRGLVIEVQAGSVTNLDSLTIRDEAGALRTFRAEGFVGLTPSHLREHKALRLPVTVRYRDTPDGATVVSVID